MSFDIGSVIAKIDADISGFQKGMNEAKQSANGFGDQLKGMGSKLADFGQQAAVFTGIAAAGLGFFAKQSIDAFNESEKTLAQLDAVLNSTKEVMSQQKKTTTTTRLSTKATAELNSKLADASARLHDMEARWAKTTDHTETASRALDKARANVASLSAQLGHAGDKMTSTFIPPTQLSRQALIDLSKELQNTTTFSDEATLGAENLLLTFTNIGKDVFPQATRTVQDMSIALGQDLKSSSIQLGKALQDPILGVTALRRVGVNFNEAQTDVIKKLVETGHAAEAQKLILKELATEFGGSAAAAAQTFGGQVEIAKNKLNDFQETIGATIAGFLYFMATGKLMPSFTDALGIVSSGPQIKKLYELRDAFLALSDWIKAHKDLVITFLQGLAIGIGALMIVGTITLLLNLLLNPLFLVAAAVTALYLAWQTNFWGIRDITMEFINNFMSFFNDILMPFIMIFVDWFTQRWTFIKLMILGTWEAIKGIIQVAWAVISGIITARLQLLTGDWKGAWDTIYKKTGDAINGVFQILGGAVHFIQGWAGTVFNELVKPFRDAWNAIQDLVNKIKNALDFTKRHSPSVLDIVKSGVSKVNDALGDLAFGGTINATAAGNAVSNGGNQNSTVVIRVDMAGAFIADAYGANQMAELVGDGIMKRLQGNVRF